MSFTIRRVKISNFGDTVVIICGCQGAAINMQEIPGTSRRSEMSAKVTAEDSTRHFPDVLLKAVQKQD